MTSSPVCGQEEGTGLGPPAVLASRTRGSAARTAPGTRSGHRAPSPFQVPEKVPQNLSTKRDAGAVKPLTFPRRFFSPRPFQRRAPPAHAYPRGRGGAAESRKGLLGFTFAAKDASANKTCFFHVQGASWLSRGAGAAQKARLGRRRKQSSRLEAVPSRGWHPHPGLGCSLTGLAGLLQGGFGGSAARSARTHAGGWQTAPTASPGYGTALPEAAAARPAAGLLRMSITHPTPLFPGDARRSARRTPQQSPVERVGLRPTAPRTPGRSPGKG